MFKTLVYKELWTFSKQNNLFIMGIQSRETVALILVIISKKLKTTFFDLHALNVIF